MHPLGSNLLATSSSHAPLPNHGLLCSSAPPVHYALHPWGPRVSSTTKETDKVGGERLGTLVATQIIRCSIRGERSHAGPVNPSPSC
eukprot:930212-Rhodomonas_salina.1